ncbi:MAG TPA: preprotein translocase subunit SecG [Candidatus Nanoarchaeia archaeon]|nr:preprotein translocase subunit SecG [Candidatus Nanoarchaeia archaeon]
MFLLKILQLVAALLLMLAILLQNKGASLSGIFGGSGNVYLSKRGFDKVLFYGSIVLAAIFFAVSLIIFLL